MPKMTWDEFYEFIATECQDEYMGEEGLMRLQEEADPEDYDIEIVEEKEISHEKAK